MRVKVLTDGALVFEKGKAYLVVRQVRNRGEERTNGSNNVGSWVVGGTNVQGMGMECNDLAHLIGLFETRQKAGTDNASA